jgi:hypothetical protein
MTRLSPVLTTADLPLAELCAARLDGELLRVDDSFTSIDQPHDRALRALTIAIAWPERMIAERWSAAWVWGALAQPPSRHTLCSSLGARARSSLPQRVSVREVVIDEDETVTMAGQRVTTPLRTITDLARFDEGVPRELLARLVQIGDVTLDECRAALDRRRNLPNKLVALTRIRAVFEL